MTTTAATEEKAQTRRSRRADRAKGSAAPPGKPKALALRARVRGALVSVRTRLDQWRELVRPYATPVVKVLGWVSPLGWLVLGSALVSWGFARYLGWREFSYAAIALAVLFALSCLLMLGRMSVSVQARVEPQRVVTGQRAALQVQVTNTGKGVMFPVPLDIPGVRDTIRFSLPTLSSGDTFEDIVVLPSEHRGAYSIGPASTLRGDPFGLVRRQVTWTDPVEFYVHPRTIYLDSLGTGLLKDLEGRSSNEMSMSDLAFHTLREYAPGDDRRHIHWLSSAKRSSSTGDDEFMVRQFLDTRRSHIGIVLDCTAANWLDEESFEVGVSAAASVALRAMRDELDLSHVAGPLLQTRPKRHTALDLYSRAGSVADSLDVAASRLARSATNVSAVLLVVGALAEFSLVRRAKSVFSPDVNVLALRIEPGAPTSLQRTGGMSVITIGSLSDLPIALQGRLSA